MSYKIKTPKRLERKAKLPEEPALDAHKTKKVHLGRPQGFQSSRVQKQVDLSKTTSTTTAKLTKLALLRHLNESCPGLMVWAKSWKFSQPLGQPQESPSPSDWGQSWKFFNLQPKDNGKPWFDLGFDANNNVSAYDVFQWERLNKAFNSENFQQDLGVPEWEKSWIFTQKRKESHEGANKSDTKLWTDNNQDYTSVWQESWRTTKPVESDSVQSPTEEEKEPELAQSDAWMFFKKELHVKSKSAGRNSAWSESWRVAKAVSEGEMTSQEKVQKEMSPDICNVIMNVSRELKNPFQFIRKEPEPSDWGKSWVTTKNQSEYNEEMNVVETREVEVNVETSALNHFMPQSERVIFNKIALPKTHHRQQEMLPFSKQTDWKDSWKTLKRQPSQRTQRRPPPQFAPMSQTLTEWANSWRFTNLTLNQDADLWQQGWSTNNHPRPVRRAFENEEIALNGPAVVRGWTESWRSTRHQHRSERQGQGASTQPVCRHSYERSTEDWEQSWRSSDPQPHQDRPSTTEWMDSWRFSCSQDLQPQHTWFEKSMELQGRKELCRSSEAFSRSCCSQTFKEQYLSKDWRDSWRVKKKFNGSGLAHLVKNEELDWDNSWMYTSSEYYQKQGEFYVNSHLASAVGSSAMVKSVPLERRSEWGRSWRLSNPHPPKHFSSWVDAKPKVFNPQHFVLWSKPNQVYSLPSALFKELKMKFWSKSWRFMKLESDPQQGQSSTSAEDKSVIMTKVSTISKHLYCNIDQLKPHQKKWSDACKMGKTQPRPKRSGKAKSGSKEDEEGGGLSGEWMEAWKFSNNYKVHEPVTVSVCLSDWKNSWKFLLDPNLPMNGPKTSKNR